MHSSRILTGEYIDGRVAFHSRVRRDIDFEERPIQPGGQHIARTADITLAAAEDFQFDFDAPGFDDLNPPDIGSQDFEELDLRLDFGDGPVSVRGESVVRQSEADESMEIEFGRDAAPPRHPRESLDSHLLGRRDDDMDLDAPSYRSRQSSLHPFGGDLDDDLGLGAGGIELGDLGISFDGLPGDNEPLPPLTPSRACKSYIFVHVYFRS